ncbi:nuclear transport factor 2 family protein [uncultured Chryseobacterium sp.]|uniref:nuclear transport factor 2 family protein n=1 Tax=uncultured Chryseobacterium sp. TaxID=259322 RepID=UPI0025FC02A2|nr:nuclear transport factor 2 family protein [uncultured Chryseobacterium sp.]
MENRERYITVIENYISTYNRFDVKGMCRDLSEDILFENISDGNVDMSIKGIENFKKQAEAATAYFSERHQRIDSWNFNNHVVTIEISYQATLAIDLPNGMKKGNMLTLKGISEFVFEDHEIISLRDIS